MTRFISVMTSDQRLNGLRLLAKIQNSNASNLLDIILQRAGVPLLTNDQLSQKLTELEEARRREHLKILEASAK